MEAGQGDARRRVSTESPYQQWQKTEEIPIYTGSYVPDLYHLEVGPWERSGAKGAFINLAEQQDDDGWLIELPPSGQSAPQHHLFEALVYIVAGRGATTFWQPGSDRKQTVEWQRGSVFSPPLNCYYQHFNLDGQSPARLFSVTHCPTVINSIGEVLSSTDFVFNNSYVFTERYSTEDDYFSNPGYRLSARIDWRTNYLADVRTFPLDLKPERGEGSSNMHIFLANNTKLMTHISEWPVGTYLKGHRHQAGAHIVILDGLGYSLLWMEGEEYKKIDWKDGDLLSPKAHEFHQHFNPGPYPVRYLAFRFGAGGWPYSGDPNATNTIQPLEEDPYIYDLFEAECSKNNVKPVYARPDKATRA